MLHGREAACLGSVGIREEYTRVTTRFGVACLTLLAGMLALAGKEADPLDHSTAYSLCTSREGLLAGCSPVRLR